MAYNALNQLIAQSLMNPGIRDTALNDALTSTVQQYGLRPDSTQKGQGFFGPLQRPDGSVSTELSIGVNLDGKETLIPLLNPNLDSSEVNYLLSGGKATKPIIDKAVNFSIGRMRSGLSPFSGNEEVPYGIKLPLGVSPEKSPEWQAMQVADTQAAAQAGLPAITSFSEEAPARARLQDAIARVQSTGLKVPHFIGTANEPTGDRGVTMDVENLVGALKQLEAQAIQTKDIQALDSISRERAFWENEAAQGMSAAEWKAQTGEDDPKR